MDARLIMGVLESNQGLGESGTTLLLGPANRSNVFSSTIMNSTASRQRPQFEVQYIVPVNETFKDRHPDQVSGSEISPFNASDFPAIYSALSRAGSRYDQHLMNVNIPDRRQVVR